MIDGALWSTAKIQTRNDSFWPPFWKQTSVFVHLLMRLQVRIVAFIQVMYSNMSTNIHRAQTIGHFYALINPCRTCELRRLEMSATSCHLSGPSIRNSSTLGWSLGELVWSESYVLIRVFVSIELWIWCMRYFARKITYSMTQSSRFCIDQETQQRKSWSFENIFEEYLPFLMSRRRPAFN